MQPKVVVITGSTKGIGFAFASEFLQLGHKVVINGRSRESVDTAVEKLKDLPGQVAGFALDMTGHDAAQRLVDFAEEKFGRIDIWINNAAIPQRFDYYLNLPDDQIRRLIDTDLTAVMVASKTVVAFMQKQGSGTVFNLAGFGSDGMIKPRLVLYGTAKRAVDYFTKAFYNEIKGGPVAMGLINPGMVNTGFLRQSLEGLPEDFVRENERFNNVFASKPGDVARKLVPQILKHNSGFVYLKYMNGFMVMRRLIKAKMQGIKF